jgi:hypothetical protein
MMNEVLVMRCDGDSIMVNEWCRASVKLMDIHGEVVVPSNILKIGVASTGARGPL